jgi:23S rRNA (cytidine1920-2'-O)/16S rRNA (cytidine1409-2'-O)-methyltransferase
VLVGGAPADKPSRLVDAGEALSLAGEPPRFVGRGGDKLDAALDGFAIDVSGLRCLDAGASTGGFTDCLLQRGASSVVAVDVGYGQMHPRLRADPRVDVRERLNVRHLTPADVAGPFRLVVADLSFISLRTVASALVELTEPGGDLVALVKPQFEVGRAEASRGRGVVRDPAKRDEAVDAVVGALAAAGAAMMGRMVSPLTGADGNVEVFVRAQRGRGGR